MRRALPCLILLLALASPAGARQSQGPAAVSVLPPPIPLAVQRQGADPLQCKAACARIRYFCAANSDDDSCAPQWAQCTARCTATYSRTNP
jgi:hypothetical protein